MDAIKEMLAKWDSPEERERQANYLVQYNARPCRYDSVRECYVHGYHAKRPCGHRCFDVPCEICRRPLTGRQRTRRAWAKRGRR